MKNGTTILVNDPNIFSLISNYQFNLVYFRFLSSQIKTLKLKILKEYKIVFEPKKLCIVFEFDHLKSIVLQQFLLK